MHDAFDVAGGSLPCGMFGEFRERSGLRHERVDKVASHGVGDTAKSGQRDAVGSLGSFEFLNVLSRHSDELADFCQTEAERFTDSADPSARRTWGEAPRDAEITVELR